MKPTCIAYTNMYLYYFHLCGFHLTIKIYYMRMKPACSLKTYSRNEWRTEYVVFSFCREYAYNRKIKNFYIYEKCMGNS